MSERNARLPVRLWRKEKKGVKMEREAFWRNELSGSSVYEQRARTSLGLICSALEEKSGQSFSSACSGSLRQNGGRLFAHAKTTGADLQQGHYEQTSLRCSAKEVVVAQDKTELNYTSQKAKTGLGQIVSSLNLRGILVHVALAVGRDGLPLGVIRQQCCTRRDAEYILTHSLKKVIITFRRRSYNNCS